MNDFIIIITNNYKRIIKSDHIIKQQKIIKNALFFKEIKKEINNDDFKTFSEIVKNVLVKPNMYQKIKQLIIDELIFDNKNNFNKNDLITFFNKLEKNGFNSFDSLIKNKKIKSILENELNNINSMEFSNNYNLITDNLLNVTNRYTCINSGILLMLEYFNSCTFMPFDAFTNIKDDYSNLNVYKLESNYLNNVYSLSDNKTEPIIKSTKLPFLSKIISVTIDSLNELFNNKKKINVDLVLYSINAKKQFPIHKNDIIDETNVNSGDTTISSVLNNPLIRIYRSEELIKVLIHEIIHCGRFESHFGNSPDHNFKLFNINLNSNKLLFNETITETLAEFLNCVLYSIIFDKNINDILTKEIDFGFIQSAKILDHFEFKSIDDFLNTKNDTRKIQQKTAAFEYHILQTILLHKFDEFLNILLNKGDTTDLMNLIIKTMRHDTVYKSKIDNYIKNIKSFSPKLILTFRMSITEIYNVNDIPDTLGQMVGGSQNKINYEYKYIKYKNKYMQLNNKNKNI